MPIDFPDAPSNGDTHTVGDKTWTWDGTVWNVVTSSGSDHGNLGGLGDDDHTQYALADGSRGTFETSGAVSTHEAASDPHNQYLLADGTRNATELTVTGDLTVDTNTLHVDSTNNRVGIGTTSPSFTLDAQGQVQVGAGDNITPDSSGNGHLMIDGAGYSGFASLDGTAMWVGHNSGSRSLNLATDETARITVTGGGNVGIGTTSPAEELHIAKDQNGDLTQILIENLDQRVRIGSYYEAGVIQYGKIQSEQDGGGDIALVLNPEGGNVGIGTTTPTGRVHMYSNTAGNGLDANYLKIDRANTSTESAINWATAGTNKWFLGHDNVGNDDFYLYSWVGGKYAIHVTPDGEVLHPEQPAFYAWKSGSTQTTTASNERITFPSVTANTGNHFNASTSLFTAPVAGVYYFSFRALTGNDGTDGDARLQYNGAIANEYSTYASNAITGHKQTILSGAISLNANDTVGISSWTSGRTFYGSAFYGHTSFSGYLIG